jgi:hypothetical protein
MWALAYAVFAAWVFAPELRRLSDYGSHFSALSIFSILPLLLMLPFGVWLVRSGRRSGNPTLRLFATVWFCAFAYAALIAAARGQTVAAIYSIAQFCLPTMTALWIASQPGGAEKTYERVARFLMICALISSAYGIVQYISPPPWDAQWQINEDVPSLGQPVPFQIRVYSTLNSPGPFADFLIFAMLMGLPLLRKRTVWLPCAYAVCTAALGLSLVRSAWIALAVAVVVYIMLVPQRVRLLFGLASLAVFVIAGSAVLFSLAPNGDASQEISNRLSTFSDLQDDGSALDRQVSTDRAIEEALSQPLGTGLGTTGLPDRLVTSSPLFDLDAIDDGYASRFLEMGYLGMLGFLVVTFGGLLYSLRAVRTAAERGMPEATAMLAAATAVQVAMICLNLGGDSQLGLGGLLYWTALALVTRWSTDVARSYVPARKEGRFRVASASP